MPAAVGTHVNKPPPSFSTAPFYVFNLPAGGRQFGGGKAKTGKLRTYL